KRRKRHIRLALHKLHARKHGAAPSAARLTLDVRAKDLLGVRQASGAVIVFRDSIDQIEVERIALERLAVQALAFLVAALDARETAGAEENFRVRRIERQGLPSFGLRRGPILVSLHEYDLQQGMSVRELRAKL